MSESVSSDPVLEAARRGDRSAQDQLLRRHVQAIHGLCRRITGDDSDALDATQDTLIAIVRGLSAFDGRSSFSTWVYRVATNVCLDELRRRKRRPVPFDPNTSSDDQFSSRSSISGHSGDSDEIGRIADHLLIDQALAQLAPEFRAAVVLRDMCQLDYAEIAEVLDIPIGTVRSRIARGRGQLADLIGHSDTGNSTAPSDRQRDRR